MKGIEEHPTPNIQRPTSNGRGGMLSISAAGFWAMVAESVARSLPAEVVEAKVDEAIRNRIAVLTLEQAQKHLDCANERMLLDFCRKHRIPVRRFSRKKKYLLLADIEAALGRAAVAVPAAERTRLTRVLAGNQEGEHRDMKTNTITLTLREILDLAIAANIVDNDHTVDDDPETEFTVIEREGGVEVLDDDKQSHRYAHGAFITEYPEEGTFPLGDPLTN